MGVHSAFSPLPMLKLLLYFGSPQRPSLCTFRRRWDAITMDSLHRGSAPHVPGSMPSVWAPATCLQVQMGLAVLSPCQRLRKSCNLPHSTQILSSSPGPVGLWVHPPMLSGGVARVPDRRGRGWGCSSERGRHSPAIPGLTAQLGGHTTSLTN